jgi:hypothetical protein
VRQFDQVCGVGGMTLHAVTRCKQRGIKTEVVELIRTHFDRDHHAGAGAAAISISRRRLAELSAEGVPASVVDQAGHTVLIVADDGPIVTAINRPTWFARFHYGADRLSYRRRSGRRTRRVRQYFRRGAR